MWVGGVNTEMRAYGLDGAACVTTAGVEHVTDKERWSRSALHVLRSSCVWLLAHAPHTVGGQYKVLTVCTHTTL